MLHVYEGLAMIPDCLILVLLHISIDKVLLIWNYKDKELTYHFVTSSSFDSMLNFQGLNMHFSEIEELCTEYPSTPVLIDHMGFCKPPTYISCW